MQLMQWQTTGTDILRRCSVCCGHHFDGCGHHLGKVDEDLCLLNYTTNCSQLSASSIMSENFMPTVVYQRRRYRKNSASFFNVVSSAGNKPSDADHSVICSDAPLLTAKEHAFSASECATEGVGSPVVHSVENDKVAAASSNGFCAVEEAAFEEPLKTHANRILNDCSANDNCSSSKSNLELSSAALKIQRDDAGECSSSGGLIAKKAPAEISERDICISILRSQGLLDKVPRRKGGPSNTGLNNKYCSKSCKVCEHMDTTKNMLICDNCDDAFHPSCNDPRIKILPVSEWLCTSCLKKKHKILKDKSNSCNLVNVGNESGRNQCSTSELDLGSLEFMFKDTEPYMSNVRIGNKFQADVPDWRGPSDEECNLIGNPLEMDTSSNIDMQDRDTIKPIRCNTIGNWIQCREVIEGAGEGVDGTVCAKWRRAPLFEVQTDNWECFRCILWDPAHADCCVPQELDTEEVMKQLKYVEMLRPRLAAKRRRVDRSKGNGSQNSGKKE